MSQFQDYRFLDEPLGPVTFPGTYLVSGFRPDISTWDELASVETYGATLPVILEWYDPTIPILRSVVLQTGTLATDTSQGVQRPDDFDVTLNSNEWFQIAQAG